MGSHRGEAPPATQVWMCVNALCVAAICRFHLGRRRFPGHTSLWILVLYAGTRFAIEHFRGDEVRGLWLGGTVSSSQLISIVAFGVGVFLLFKTRRSREPMPGVAAD